MPEQRNLPLDFVTIDGALQAVGLGIGAAEAHGIICGVLCVPAVEDGGWLEEIMRGNDPDEDPETCNALLLALYAATRDQLASEELEFQPLLPKES